MRQEDNENIEKLSNEIDNVVANFVKKYFSNFNPYFDIEKNKENLICIEIILRALSFVLGKHKSLIVSIFGCDQLVVNDIINEELILSEKYFERIKEEFEKFLQNEKKELIESIDINKENLN